MRRSNRTRRNGRVVVMGAVTMAAIAGCGSSSPDLTLTLDEYAITADPQGTDSAKVSFDVDNVGSKKHELILARFDGDPAAMPVAGNGQVDLAQIEVVDSLHAVGPGRYEAVFPAVPKGRYVLFCNLAPAEDGGPPVAHYARGMWLELDVTQSPDDAPPV